MNTKNINWWKVGSIIVGVILVFILGIYIGKKTTKPKIVTHTEYVELPPIHDTLPPPPPIKETIDTANLIKQCVKDGIYQELFPEKIVYLTDTSQFTKPDSSAIMFDWATKRDYSVELFNIDTVGTCTVNTSVQYNRLGKLDYTFNPVQKQTTTTITQKRKYLPYAGVGLSTFPSVGAEVGLFINQSWGFSINANYFFYNGTINNVVTTTTANISLQSTNIQDNTPIPTYQTSTLKIPKFDVGIKILKMF